MKVRQKFLQWLHGPQFFYELYDSEDLPTAGETLYIKCGIMDCSIMDCMFEPVYWAVQVSEYDSKFKYLRRKKILTNLPNNTQKMLRVYYNKNGKMVGSRVVWYREKEAINGNKTTNYIFS